MATIEFDAALLARYPFEAVLEDEEGSAWAIFFPDAPGCMTRAESWEEIGPAAREALHWWLQACEESGLYLPAPSYYDAREATANGRQDLRREYVKLDPDKQKLFTVREVSEYYGITPGRVRQIAGEQNLGKLIGNVRIFRRKDFDAFGCRQGPGRPRKKAKAEGSDSRSKRDRVHEPSPTAP